MTININFYFGWILYNLILFTLLLMEYKHVEKSQKKLLLGCYIFLFFILSLFGNAISPDYISYREIVKEVATTQYPFVHIEEFYIGLIHKIGNDFFLYQFCVYVPIWGLIYLLFTKWVWLERPELFLFMFAILSLYSVLTGRQYLFIIVYLFGVVLFANKKYMMGCVCLFVSFFLHKIAYIVLPLTPLIFFPLKVNTKQFVILGILVTFLVGKGRDMIENNLMYEILASYEVAGSSYLFKTEGANAGGSFWWKLIDTYQTGVKFLLIFFVLYRLRRIVFLPVFSINRVMYFLLFWVSIVSLLFYGLNLPDSTIAQRTLGIGLIPLCYLCSLLPKYVVIKRWYRMCFVWILFFYMMFNNAYIVGVSHSTLK